MDEMQFAREYLQHHYTMYPTFEWITKDMYGDVYAWDEYPVKDKETGTWQSYSTNFRMCIPLGVCKWTDEEPLNIKEFIFRGTHIEEEVQTEQMQEKHYEGTIDPIDLMEAQFTEEAFLGFIRGNIIKYATRYGKKDDVHKEARKILHYAQILNDYLDGKGVD